MDRTIAEIDEWLSHFIILPADPDDPYYTALLEQGFVSDHQMIQGWLMMMHVCTWNWTISLLGIALGSYLSMKLAFGPPIGSTELAKLSLIVSFLSLVTLWISTRMPYVHKSSTRLGKEMCTQMARVSLRTYPICLLEIWSLR